MSLLKDLLNGDFKWEGVKEFVSDYPISSALIVGAGAWWALAPAAATTVATGVGASGTPLLPATSLPGFAGIGAYATSPVATSTASTVGSSGAIGNFFMGTPGRQMMTGVGVSALGNYLAAKGAAQEQSRMAAEGREFEMEMFDRNREARKISYVPNVRGRLAAKKLSLSPREAVDLRKAGDL